MRRRSTHTTTPPSTSPVRRPQDEDGQVGAVGRVHLHPAYNQCGLAEPHDRAHDLPQEPRRAVSCSDSRFQYRWSKARMYESAVCDLGTTIQQRTTRGTVMRLGGNSTTTTTTPLPTYTTITYQYMVFLVMAPTASIWNRTLQSHTVQSVFV